MTAPTTPPPGIDPIAWAAVQLMAAALEARPDKYRVEIDEKTGAIVSPLGVTVTHFNESGMCDACAVNERVVIVAEREVAPA